MTSINDVRAKRVGSWWKERMRKFHFGILGDELKLRGKERGSKSSKILRTSFTEDPDVKDGISDRNAMPDSGKPLRQNADRRKEG